ncbi:MAG: hypothetical protein HFE95_00285 [Acutalibacter sp.]|jgi:hypothetical protein|nr:hypothetical protein [Acutalibacter sp.]
MQELEQRAYSYLGRAPVMRMDMLEALRRGCGSVAAVREDGALIYVGKSGAYLLAAENLLAAEALCAAILSRGQVAVHNLDNARLVADKLGYEQMMVCRAAAYLEPAPPPLELAPGQELVSLSAEHLEEALARFPEAFSAAELEEMLRGGTGLCLLEGELLGVIGLYPEGGIAMPALMPGREELCAPLIAGMTRWCLENCLAPFAHIEDGMAEVYQQLGFSVSEKEMAWLG